MGGMITVKKRHPLVEKQNRLRNQYGYLPPSVAAELDDFKNKSGRMYDWSKDDVNKALAEDTEYTYEFDRQEKADEFEAAYQELLKETDAEKEFNQAMWAMSDHGASWKPADATKIQEPIAITPQSIADLWGAGPESMPAARDLTAQEQAALLAKLKAKPTEQTAKQKNQAMYDTWLKSFGSGEL
jgi:hypothetical protein